jgi:hypothetical protein
MEILLAGLVFKNVVFQENMILIQLIISIR